MDMRTKAGTPEQTRSSRFDSWFRNEVRKALADVDRSDRVFVTHEEMMRIARARFGFQLME